MMSCGIAPATPYWRSSRVYSPNSYVPQPARQPAAGPPGSVQRDIVLGGTQSSLCPSGHRIESTVRYLGIEVDDALEISEQTEI